MERLGVMYYSDQAQALQLLVTFWQTLQNCIGDLTKQWAPQPARIMHKVTIQSRMAC